MTRAAILETQLNAYEVHLTLQVGNLCSGDVLVEISYSEVRNSDFCGQMECSIIQVIF